MVAAGDGSPSSPAGYCALVVAHAIVTVVLLIALVAAAWQFMNWVQTPSCPKDAAPASVAQASPLRAPALDPDDCG
jgi:hypothetical protein